MPFYAILKNNIVKQVIGCDNSSLVPLPTDEQYIEVDTLYDADKLYFDGTSIQTRPPEPAPLVKWDYTNNVWIDYTTDDYYLNLIREKRNKLLLESDWTQLPDVSLDTKQAWAVYRQQLRDMPENQQDVKNPVWPTPPV